MSQAAAKVQEPSMEEILASIRRIIADDDTSKTPAKPASPIVAAVPPPEVAAPPPPPPAPPPSPDQSEVDAMLAKLDAPPGGVAPEKDSQDILELTESMAAPDDDAPIFQTIDGQSDVVFADTPGERFASPRNGADRPLLAPTTSAAVDSAFNALAHTVLVNNARTLEDLVREMLRPMLKSWLDDNLPTMVERIVKAEIDRVARGRG